MNIELLIFIIGLCICAISTGIFLYYRINKGGIAGVLTKTVASFVFVAFALLLSYTKNQSTHFAGLSITFFILGLICGLIGDVLLDLKVIYPFHDDKYLKAGMTAFLVGHLFNISALLTLVNAQIDLFANYIALIIIFACAIILSIAIWIVSIKILNLDFRKNTLLVNFYSFVLILTTILSVFLCFVLTTAYLIILAIGFVFFLLSDMILSTQYFGGKQDDKNLIFLNHLFYYIAQILIASSIFFI